MRERKKALANRRFAITLTTQGQLSMQYQRNFYISKACDLISFSKCLRAVRMYRCGQLQSESQQYWKTTFFGELCLLYYFNFLIKEISIKNACLLYEK